jgi:exonuclease VII large subunit
MQLKYFQAKRKYKIASEMRKLFDQEYDEKEFPRCKFVRVLYNGSQRAKDQLDEAKLNLGQNVLNDKQLNKLDAAQLKARSAMINALRDFTSEKSAMTAIEDDRNRSLYKTQNQIHKRVQNLEDQLSTLDSKLDEQNRLLRLLLKNQGVQH